MEAWRAAYTHCSSVCGHPESSKTIGAHVRGGEVAHNRLLTFGTNNEVTIHDWG